MYFRKQTPSTAIPQSEPLNARQIPNAAGGYVFAVDRWDALDRFLTIGTEGGTFYVGQEPLTEQAETLVIQCLEADGVRVVTAATAVSAAGRAIKQDYAIFALALALASRDDATRAEAYRAIPQICRTASTLFQLLSYLRGRRGWSAGLRRAIASWYDEMPVEKLAYQLVKYRSRNDYTHRDALRLSHPSGTDEGRQALYAWAVGKSASDDSLPRIVRDYLAAADATEPDADLARRLPREALPTAWLNEAAIWEALLFGDDGGNGMPVNALLRNLGNLSKHGILTANSPASAHVAQRLGDADAVAKARVHPFAIYLAQKVYGSGRSVKGLGLWAPVGAVVDALDRAFTLAFRNVKPTGKRILVAFDVSGSMTRAWVANTPLSADLVASAMAFITARVEPNAHVIGFDYDPEYRRGGSATYTGAGVYPVMVAADERLRDFQARVARMGDGTDCAMPFRYALANDLDVDAVVVYTDSETWAGHSHAAAELAVLRAKLRHRVKVAIASTTFSSGTVADPNDRDVLQVAGFDASAPAIIADFIAR